MFGFAQQGSDCQVQGKSQSASIQTYDWHSNYCNMWNMYNTVGGSQDIKNDNCPYSTNRPEKHCIV